MITCPRCGAENKPTATQCRMCATQLELPATLIAPQGAFESPDPKGGGAGPGEVLCATCGAVNEATWAFCQQCGSPLQRAAAPPPPPPPAPTPPPPVPPTVVAPPVVAPPTVMAQPAPAAPPTVMSQPAAAPPTVVAQPSPGYTAHAGSVVPPQEVPVGTSNIVNGVNCANCGKVNPQGSSFCSACGSALPVEKTLMMMASSRNTPTARLRLIQEGGGEGEVYKLETDETIVGRNQGDIRFPHDGYMSGRHARIVRQGENYVLVDERSKNGTFKKIDGEVPLKSGDVILVGKQLFRFEVG